MAKMTSFQDDDKIQSKRDEAIRRALEMPHRPLKKKDDAAKPTAKKVKASKEKSNRPIPEKA